MEANLSERQKTMWEFISQFMEESSYPPTIREIGEAVGISSTSVVDYNLNALQRKGYIERDRSRSRGLKLLRNLPGMRQGEVLDIPLLGYIAAGAPMPIPDSSADFNLMGDETIELTRGLVQNGSDLFALRVKGESMIDALVYDGDVVVLEHREEANNGDMVAAWLQSEGETTLKRYYHEGARVRLQPANPTMEPIYCDPANVQIQGKVVCVVRQLN